MTSPPPTTFPVLTWQVLDQLGGEAALAVLGAWAMRPELPFEEWINLVVELLVDAIGRGHAVGFERFAPAAVPVDGNAIVPTDDVPRQRGPAHDDELEAIQRDRGSVPRRTTEADLRKRVEKAVRTIAADTNELAGEDRIDRMARSETIAAVQEGYQDGLVEFASPEIQKTFEAFGADAPLKGVGGYRRGINPSACEVCFWTWKQGYVYPLSRPMWQHPGCRCIPIPTTDRIGRHDLSDDEQALLDDLYKRHITDKKAS